MEPGPALARAEARVMRAKAGHAVPTLTHASQGGPRRAEACASERRLDQYGRGLRGKDTL